MQITDTMRAEVLQRAGRRCEKYHYKNNNEVELISWYFRFCISKIALHSRRLRCMAVSAALAPSPDQEALSPSTPSHHIQQQLPPRQAHDILGDHRPAVLGPRGRVRGHDDVFQRVERERRGAHVGSARLAPRLRRHGEQKTSVSSGSLNDCWTVRSG